MHPAAILSAPQGSPLPRPRHPQHEGPVHGARVARAAHPLARPARILRAHDPSPTRRSLLLAYQLGRISSYSMAGLLIGAAAGAGAGALSGALGDYGIDDDFIKSLGEQIGPDSSALFVLLRKVTLDKVVPDLGKYEGTVLKTSLSNEQEQELRSALARHESAA